MALPLLPDAPAAEDDREAVDTAFHEMMNHLGVALLNASMLRRRVPAAAREHELATRLVDSVTELGRLTEELRVLVRLTQGPPLQRQPLQLDAVLEEALAISEPMAKLPAEFASLQEACVLGERSATVRLFASLGTIRKLRVQPRGATVHFELDARDAIDANVTVGLALAERLVRAHGGHWLRRGDGCLSFTLPGAVSA